ncbi:hypothetical protein R1sor_012846 [Riccia sorocarpa]|uniref:GDSL esterase/lipase n=1 Tax=Riccia sorocarpa TaxID=122646 RepID=A0ABD3I8I4_9MARC
MEIWLYAFISVLVVGSNSAAAQVTPPFIVFGDSTVDTGNNNYINTTKDFLANFPPYGQKYFDKPTGRFSNGRLFVDFLCLLAGRALLSPYLEPGADHSKGVNFASGGSGMLDETNAGLVIPMNTQLQYFSDFQDGLSEKWGIEVARKYFSDAIYLISHGNNDYMGGYFAKPELQQKYSPQEFVSLVVSKIIESLEILRSKGARKVVVIGVGPLGCIPAVRAMQPSFECFEQGTQLAFVHNAALEQALKQWASEHPDVTLVYGEFLTYMTERQSNPTLYGFTESATACCGQTAPCGRSDPTTGAQYTVCENPDHHVYWDAFHASEKIGEGWSREVWDGSTKMISPINLRTLFEMSSTVQDQLAELEAYAGGSAKTLEQITS